MQKLTSTQSWYRHKKCPKWGGSWEKVHNVKLYNFCFFTNSFGGFNEETSVENRLKKYRGITKLRHFLWHAFTCIFMTRHDFDRGFLHFVEKSLQMEPVVDIWAWNSTWWWPGDNFLFIFVLQRAIQQFGACNWNFEIRLESYITVYSKIVRGRTLCRRTSSLKWQERPSLT